MNQINFYLGNTNIVRFDDFRLLKDKNLTELSLNLSHTYRLKQFWVDDVFISNE